MTVSFHQPLQSASSSVKRLIRFLMVSDPGQLRLRAACQTTATVVASIVALMIITTLIGQPITSVMLGTVVAMISSFAVTDRTPHARLLTNALMVIPALLTVSVSTLLGQYGVLADIGFIVVLFTAVYVRRFGPRGFALGMAGFIAYFFALFLRAQLSTLPYLLMSVTVGIVMSLSVRFIFQHEWAGAELTRLTRALRVACRAVLDDIDPQSDPVSFRKANDPRGRDERRNHLERLANTALMIEDWLDRHVAASLISVTGEDLSRRIFDAQQATEQLAFAARDYDLKSATPVLLEAVGALRSVLYRYPSDEVIREARKLAASAEGSATGSDRESVVIRAVARAVRAHIAVHRVAAHTMAQVALDTPSARTDFDDETVSTEQTVSENHASQSTKPRLHRVFDRMLPSTRTAIQVAIATSLATFAGEMVSQQRWYWAVLSAFVVFNGTTTRGEILTRAGHRVVGTIAGVAAGIGLALLIGHNPPVQLVVMIVCIFFAFYLVTVANGLLVFFVTVLLAMLYELLGLFSIDLLELRIIETCIGAGIGLAAAFFVLPTRTRETVRDKVDDYLSAMDDLVAASVESVITPGTCTDLVPKVRAVDTALQALQVATKPLRVGATAYDARPPLRLAPASRARRTTARLVRVLESCDRAAHSLARAGIVAANAEPSTAPTDQVAHALQTSCDEVRRSLGALASVVRGDIGEYDESPSENSPVAAIMKIDPAELSAATRAAVRALDRLDHCSALTRVPV